MKSILIFFCLMCLAPRLWARSFETQGDLALWGSSLPALDMPDVTKENGGVDLNLQSRYLLSKRVSLRLQTWARADLLTKTHEEKNQFELPELALEYKKSARKIKAGYSTLHWEGTDILNPMDLMSVKNWRDPLNPQSRGMAGFFYSDQEDHFSWDLAYVPVQTRALLPGEKSPWWPRRLQLPVENEDLVLRLPDQVSYAMSSDEVLNHALLHNAALRLQYHGESWDFSLGGMEGSAGTPLLFPILDVTPVQVYPKQIYQLNSPVRLQPVYYRQRAAAFALVRTGSSWILRLAGQHAQSLGDDSRLPGWSEYGVLAFEKSIPWGDQGLTLLFQATASRRPRSNNVSVISTLLEKALMFGWRWPLNEKWTWTAALFQEQKYFSYYAHTDLGYALSDRWSAQVAGDFFSGSRESVLGIYDHNDRAAVKLTYSF